MRYERGFGLTGFMFWGVVWILLAVLAMKVTPSLLDFYMTKKAIRSVASQAAPDASVAEMRRAYGKFAEIDRLELKPTELDISKKNGRPVIAFSYEKSIPIFGNVTLVIEYESSTED